MFMKNSLPNQMLVAVIMVLLLATKSNAQTLTLQLTPSNYNGYGVSCFAGRNGSIDLTVTGGTAPYTYQWSNGEKTEDISNLSAQYYRVHVTDANGIDADGEITLTEPEPLKMEISIYEYPNHFNISLFGACNGIATLTLNGGVPPFTYLWSDGSTNQNRTTLCSRNYGVIATDANGCKVASEKIYLTEPAESNWTQTGNANTNPSTNFIGTTDNNDFLLKTNSLERFRIKANGNLKIPSLASNTVMYSTVFADSLGNLMVSKFNTACFPSWYGDFSRNTLTADCPNVNIKVGIGTRYPIFDFEVYRESSLNAEIRMKCQTEVAKNVEIWTINAQGSFAFATDPNGKAHIYRNISTPTSIITFDNMGRVGIGLEPPNNGTYKLYVEGGIAAREVKVTTQIPFPDYVFSKDYKLMSLYELEQFIKANNRLPEMPSAKEVEKNNGFEVGKMQINLLKKIEEQALYIIDLQKQIDEMKEQFEQLEKKK